MWLTAQIAPAYEQASLKPVEQNDIEQREPVLRRSLGDQRDRASPFPNDFF